MLAVRVPSWMKLSVLLSSHEQDLSGKNHAAGLEITGYFLLYCVFDRGHLIRHQPRKLIPERV